MSPISASYHLLAVLLVVQLGFAVPGVVCAADSPLPGVAVGYSSGLGDHPPTSHEASPTALPQTLQWNPLVASMIDQVSQAELYSEVAQLSGAAPAVIGGSPYTITTRSTDSGMPIQKATEFAFEYLQAAGVDASYFEWTSGGHSNRDVVGTLSGVISPTEVVLVSAHLDDLPGTGRAPGAEDDASGSAAILTAAGILGQYRFERTIRFVLFTGEEQGHQGSLAYAAHLRAQGENIIGVFNLDAVASHTRGDPIVQLHGRSDITPGSSTDVAIAMVFSLVVGVYDLGGSLVPIIILDNFPASDHVSFWKQGYPGVMVIDNYPESLPKMHKVDDTVQKLNIPYFANVVKALIGAAAHLALPMEARYTWTVNGAAKSTGGEPIAGATAWLLRSQDSEGPFEEIAAGSLLLSPTERTNPQTTSASGQFAWIATPAYYQVRLERSGCYDPANADQTFVVSSVLPRVPAQQDVELRLVCPTAATQSSWIASILAYGRSFTDAVSGWLQQLGHVILER
jgi:Peptidase family M28